MVVKDYELDLTTDDRFLHVWNDATPEDWEKLADKSRIVELVDGRLIVHSPVSLTHSRIGTFLSSVLNFFVETRGLGEVHLAPFTMDVGLTRKFEPDIMFIAQEHVSRFAEDRLLGPADLVIEVASRSTRTYDRVEKRTYYQEAGVGEYWIIDPLARKLALDRPAGTRVGEVSSGVVESEVIEGWWIKVEWLWERQLPSVVACFQEILRGPP